VKEFGEASEEEQVDQLEARYKGHRDEVLEEGEPEGEVLAAGDGEEKRNKVGLRVISACSLYIAAMFDALLYQAIETAEKHPASNAETKRLKSESADNRAMATIAEATEKMQAQQTLMSEQIQLLRNEIRNLVSGAPARGGVSDVPAHGLAVQSASVNQTIDIDPHTQDLLKELKALAAEQKLAPEMYQKLCMLHGLDDKVAGKQGTGESVRKVEWVCNELARKLTAEQACKHVEEQAQKLVAGKAGNQTQKQARKQVSEQVGKQEETQEQAREVEEQTNTKGLGSADIELVAQLPGHPYIDKWLIAGNGVEGLERYEQMLTIHFSVSFTFISPSDSVLLHAPVPG
jgi:hypothetical protein